MSKYYQILSLIGCFLSKCISGSQRCLIGPQTFNLHIWIPKLVNYVTRGPNINYKCILAYQGQSQHRGRGVQAPLPPGTPLEAKGKKEERGERRKKKREEEKGAPLVLGLAPPLLPMQHHLNMSLSMPSATHFALHE